MRTKTTWLNLLFILLLAVTASGGVSAKAASGLQDLGLELHQADDLSNWLLRQEKTQSSYDDTLGSPVVPKGGDITEATIRKALKGDTTKASQDAVSLPKVQRAFDQLSTSKAPNIKMDGDVITDGHHRFIAGKIKGQTPGVDGGVLTRAKQSKVRPISDIKVSPRDFDQ